MAIVLSHKMMPTYHGGYARCAAESEAPHLWKGCVGAWYPTLGPTGVTLRDVSGWHTNAGLSGSYAWSSSGYVGSELLFNGAAGGGTISSGNPAIQNIPVGGSWAILVLMRTATDGRILFQAQNYNPLVYLSIGPTTASGAANKLVAYVRSDGAAETVIPINGATTITDGQWHQCGMVIKPGSVRLYVDGVDDGGAGWTGNQAITTSGNSSYLASLDAPGYVFDGPIAKWLVWNRALTASEIAEHAADPWAMLRPKAGWVPYVPAAGGPFPHYTRRRMTGGMITMGVA